MTTVEKNPLCNGEGRIHNDRSWDYCNCPACVRYLLAAVLKDAQIPVRYQDASLETIQPESESQTTAISRARQYVATWPERQKLGEGMAFIGQNSRAGKTHIGAAVLLEIGEKYLVRFGIENKTYRLPLFFLSASAYIWSWRQFYARPKPPEDHDDAERWNEHKRITRNEEFAHTAPLLLIDDLGEVSGTEFASGKLYELIEHRVSNLLPSIVTSNLNWDQIAQRYGDSGARIVGRLKETTAEFTVNL